MNYNLVEGTDKSKYDIVEKSTSQVIATFEGRNFLDARAFLRFMNLGGGFDGFTPSFVLKKIILSTEYGEKSYK